MRLNPSTTKTPRPTTAEGTTMTKSTPDKRWINFPIMLLSDTITDPERGMRTIPAYVLKSYADHCRRDPEAQSVFGYQSGGLGAGDPRKALKAAVGASRARSGHLRTQTLWHHAVATSTPLYPLTKRPPSLEAVRRGTGRDHDATWPDERSDLCRVPDYG